MEKQMEIQNELMAAGEEEEEQKVEQKKIKVSSKPLFVLKEDDEGPDQLMEIPVAQKKEKKKKRKAKAPVPLQENNSDKRVHFDMS